MKTLLNYFSVILIFQLIAFSAYGQYSLSDVGVSLKEDMIWSDNCKMPAIYQSGDTLSIQGHFDGIRSNTRLIIEGQLINPSHETLCNPVHLTPHFRFCLTPVFRPSDPLGC
jgi:hypothetical protein